MVILDIIQLAAVIALFIITIKQKKDLADKDLEIHALSVELDNLKLAQSKEDFNLTEEEMRVNDEVITTLNKIQKNYQVYKSDKIKLIKLLIVIFKYTDINLINRINVSKQYTYKRAAEHIINYIEKPMSSTEQLIETLNAIYYLVTK